MSGPRTQVLVLGTMHLSNLPKSFNPESLGPLLDKLAAYKPDVIAIEAISGEGCDFAARYPALYDPDSIRPYCRDNRAAMAATGLDVPAAIAEMTRTLKQWPAQTNQPTSAQRRRLAAVFLAAHEETSSLVQWLQLPEAERVAADGLDAALVQELNGLITKKNEDYLITAPLAARLGLPRVYSMDDHTGDNVDYGDEAGYGKAIQAAWDSVRPQSAPIRKRAAELAAGDDMLPAYRYLNSPEHLRIATEVDFGAALKEPSPQHYGRLYVAGWETRNMRMAANIHASFSAHPGARVLIIVGAAHKPWLDHMLGMQQGVDIVDVEAVLAPTGDNAAR
jgi:hypothetical protein